MNTRKEFEQMMREKYENTGGLIVQRNGNTIYEYYLNECTETSPFHVYSVTKSIVSILLGIAMDEGLIKSLDQKILDFYPDYVVKEGEKTIQNITLRDMMTMTAPYKDGVTDYESYFTSEDWVKASLDLLGGEGKIGEFQYAPLIGPDIFTGILCHVTGKSVLDYAKEKLFLPLGIDVPFDIIFHSQEEQMKFYESRTIRGWVAGPSKVHTGGWGLILTPKDMVKIGQLYLNQGSFNGQQIVSSNWIQESTRMHSQWNQLMYGYLWWVVDEKEHSYAAMGDGGNVIYVNTEKDLVIVIASYFKPDAFDRISLIKEYIEPIFTDK